MVICHARRDGRTTECDHPIVSPGTATRNIIYVNCVTCLANLTQRVCTGREHRLSDFMDPVR